MTIVCRGIRGATTVQADTREAVLSATKTLLQTMTAENDIDPDDIASIIFTTTPDVVAEYPALAARQIGWQNVPLLCGHEMAVPHGLKHCIRVLIHWNTSKSPTDIKHIYLNEAESLRPDLALQTLNQQLQQEKG